MNSAQRHLSRPLNLEVGVTSLLGFRGVRPRVVFAICTFGARALQGHLGLWILRCYWQHVHAGMIHSRASDCHGCVLMAVTMTMCMCVCVCIYIRYLSIYVYMYILGEREREKDRNIMDTIL